MGFVTRGVTREGYVEVLDEVQFPTSLKQATGNSYWMASLKPLPARKPGVFDAGI